MHIQTDAINDNGHTDIGDLSQCTSGHAINDRGPDTRHAVNHNAQLDRCH